MKCSNFLYFFFLFTLVVNGQENGQEPAIPIYKDSTRSVETRTNDLIERMSLAEKIAQLSHIHSHQIYSGQHLDKVKLKNVAGNKSYACVEGFTLTGTNASRAMNTIQKYMVEETRLGIPILTVTESLHGSVHDGSTIFPQSIAMGSTFNPGLAYDMATIVSKELKAQGMNQTLSPGLDVVRDLRWGRVEESFGEDPYLVGKMGAAQVRGYLDNGISPMIKPYGPGGAPLGGLNLASVESGERAVREIYLKPYEMVVKSTDVMAVMTSYNSWNKIPNSSSEFLLTDILREEWGFDGYVYSDWGAVAMLHDFQRTAKSYADAAKQALIAGNDVEASSTCYQELEELVRKDNLDESYINRAVKRVLRTKFKMGLFENPYTDTTDYQRKVHTSEAVELSRKIADESIVLLKNDGLLPLAIDDLTSIAVIGPNADQVQFGDYTWSRNNRDGVTPLDGMKNLLKDNVQIHYAKGSDLITDNRTGFKEAVEAAKKSDVSVIFVGSASASLARDYSNATSGEGYDLSSLELTGVQEEMIKEIYKIGKPVIVVLVTGKPFAIPWLKKHIPSIVVQWYGGERGGDAIAEMLFGKTNPSAKLPFSFPQSVGHLPVYYNHLPTDKGYYNQPGSPSKPGRDYVFSSPDPAWSFGHGLSYTSFEYLNVKFSDTILNPSDTLDIEIRIHNSGTKKGKEVVQLYVRDLVSSVVTPVKELKAFDKPSIQAADTATVILKLPISELALYNLKMKKVVEPGKFEIQIGSASDNIHLKKNITIIDKNQYAKDLNEIIEKQKEKEKNKTVSQKSIVITGEIRDVQATPVTNANIQAVRMGKRVKVDKNGEYAIKAFTDDTLIFSAPGYEEKIVEVNEQININIRLNYKHN